jgi:enoyl-CoA hydratase/carnithine racemase
MSSDYIKTEIRGGVLILTMHDPATRNAINPEMARELFEALDRFEDDPEQRVLLLTGTEPSFCSGANVRGFSRSIQEREQQGSEARPRPWGSMETRHARRFGPESSRAPEMVLRLQEQQKPTIAAVNGHAIGAGMGLALACDIRIAAEKAQFSEAFVRMGLIPADGSCWNLPRLIGLSNTLMLQYSGDRVDGNEAFRLGLVSKVVADADLMESALELATRLAQGANGSQSLIKYLVRQGLDQSFRDHLDLAHVAQDQARTTADHKEAVQAFLEKRSPEFKGE